MLDELKGSKQFSIAKKGERKSRFSEHVARPSSESCKHEGNKVKQRNEALTLTSFDALPPPDCSPLPSCFTLLTGETDKDASRNVYNSPPFPPRPLELTPLRPPVLLPPPASKELIWRWEKF